MQIRAIAACMISCSNGSDLHNQLNCIDAGEGVLPVLSNKAMAKKEDDESSLQNRIALQFTDDHIVSDGNRKQVTHISFRCGNNTQWKVILKGMSGSEMQSNGNELPLQVGTHQMLLDEHMGQFNNPYSDVQPIMVFPTLVFDTGGY